MYFIDNTLIFSGVAALLGFVLGWATCLAATRKAIAQWRTHVGAKQAVIDRQDVRLREQGRAIGEFIAADQRRHAALSAAGRKGNAAGVARRQAKAALSEAAAKAKPAGLKKSGAPRSH